LVVVTDLDPDKITSFVERIQGSLTGAATSLMTHLGDRLGLYQSLAEVGSATPSELALRTGCSERYLREWLAQQAVAGFVNYDAESGRFSLPPEHWMLLARTETPSSFAGGFEALAGMYLSVEQVTNLFRTGGGLAWGDHDERVHRGAARFFGAAYRQSLVDDWVPALGLTDILEGGATVADVGCGEGVATTLLATAFPASRFLGIDTHRPSIDLATRRATEAGVTDRARFEVGDATSFAGGPYDVIWFFDSFHDLADPAAAAAHARKQIADEGVVVLVEPFAADDLAENITTNPVAALHYTASTFLCLPNSLTHLSGGTAMGGQAGGRVLAAVLAEGGLHHFERVVGGPMHAVYTVRP
jgi:2-polyprenyl-3-methyl-5-hydroxy-6-metoxy-1,4-benzoquinol methylase